MSTKNNPGDFDCYAKADGDEPMFVLLGRDPSAPDLVRLWAAQRATRKGADQTVKRAAKIDEAFFCAREMEMWQGSITHVSDMSALELIRLIADDPSKLNGHILKRAREIADAGK